MDDIDQRRLQTRSSRNGRNRRIVPAVQGFYHQWPSSSQDSRQPRFRPRKAIRTIQPERNTIDRSERTNWIILSLEEEIIQVPQREGLGLSKSVILNHLKIRKCPPDIAANEEVLSKICVVCQDKLYEETRVVGSLECRHEYHEGCIEAWLEIKNTCPLCNAVGIIVDD